MIQKENADGWKSNLTTLISMYMMTLHCSLLDKCSNKDSMYQPKNFLI